MSIVATLEALAAAGGTPEQLIAVVRAHEAAKADALSQRRAADAARQKAMRERKNNVTSRYSHVTERDSRDPTPRARVVNTTSSSLRSEEAYEPVSPDGDTPPSKPKLAKPNGFARFWEAYPNKVAKPAAEKAYARALRTISGPDPPAEILAGVERAKASRAWAEGFIPHPTTWLNQGRWADEPAEVINLHPRDGHERSDQHQSQTPREDRLGRMLRGAMAAADEREPDVGGRRS